MKYTVFIALPEFPTTLGDVWVGETRPSIDTLLKIIALQEEAKETSKSSE